MFYLAHIKNFANILLSIYKKKKSSFCKLCRFWMTLVVLCEVGITDAPRIDNLCRSQWSWREHIQCCLYLMFSWAQTLTGLHTKHTCSPTCAKTHTRACTTSKRTYCNSFIYRGSVYLACVMGRLIGGFSNYELGKAAGWRRQSDPSLLLWCISRAPTTADPIHMAINGALYINVIPVLPHISAWITPTTNYSNPMFYWVERCCGCKS